MIKQTANSYKGMLWFYRKHIGWLIGINRFMQIPDSKIYKYYQNFSKLIENSIIQLKKKEKNQNIKLNASELLGCPKTKWCHLLQW